MAEMGEGLMTDSKYNNREFLAPNSKELKLSSTPMVDAVAYYVTKEEGPTGDLTEEVVPASLARSFEADEVWDLEKDFWQQIKNATIRSNWIPEDYFMNDWVSDVCSFLEHGVRDK